MIEIGTTIDDTFRVERRIGEGAFGVVYRCQHLRLEIPVALKVLKRDKTDERDLKRFMAEGRHLAKLNHPNVVRVYQLGTFEDLPYIAMELLDGRSLSDVAHGERLPLRANLKILRQVALGLEAAHAVGILHHDLSLNNIICLDSGGVKLLDFGLAKDTRILGSRDSRDQIVGTIMFLAPEQIEGQGTTPSSEIFSFGVILHELLTGENPFRAEHHMSVLFNIVNRPPEVLEERIRNCPPALSELVHRCLEKRPEDRPADMAEIGRRLDQILALDALDVATTTTGPGIPTLPRASSRNPYLNRNMIKNREAFFGRRQEVQRIFARLNANPPGSISLVGDRKIGKSSLLNYIYMSQQRQRYLEHPESTVMVFLDLQQEKSMSLQSFVKALLGIANFELRGRLDVSTCTLDLDGIKDMVQRLDQAGYRLAILLDEFDCVTTNANFDVEFFSFLRFLANHYNVAYLTSSARNLQVLCHTKEIADSPFFNIFSTMRLSAFVRDEAEELIRVPSERADKPLAKYTDRILEMSGLFPFYIQMLCAHVIEYLDENPGQEPHFGQIRARFMDEAKLHYRYLWDSFDMHERSAVLRVARAKNIPDSLRHVVGELEGRHYLEPGPDKPRLFSATFEDFVKTEGSRSPEPSILARIFRRGGKS